MPRTSYYKSYLDGWRGLAILCVLYSHFLSIGNTRWIGSFGVDLFFVLSGFLMAEILFIRKQRLKIFFIRRISRIAPVFVIYVGVAFTISKVIPFQNYQITSHELLSTLAFLRSYYPVSPSIWQANWSIGHLWSLNIEEHTYMFLAALAYLTKYTAKNTVIKLLIFSIMVTFIFRFMYASDFIIPGSDFTLYSHVAGYAIMVPVTFRLLVDWKYDFLVADSTKQSMSIFCFVSAIIVSSPLVEKPILAPCFLAISICYFEHNSSLIKRVLSINVFKIFGKAAFSLYLWQQIFYDNFDNAIVGLCLALITGFMCYLLVENPLRLYINRKYGNSSN